jgi:hypothetical protein
MARRSPESCPSGTTPGLRKTAGSTSAQSGCADAVGARMSRRRFLARIGGATAGVLWTASCTWAPERSGNGSGVSRDEPVGLVVIGDYGTGGSDEVEVASAIQAWSTQHPFDALVTVGDNVYGSATPTRLAQVWQRPYGWVEGSGAKVLAAVGDNDEDSGRLDDVMALLGMPARWYRRTIRSVDVFVLDSTRGSSQEQLQWLQRELSQARGKWRVVVFHHPPFTCSGEGGRLDLRERWHPLFARHGVDLVLSGNHHSYQHFSPLQGVTYIVAGGGGAPLHNIEPVCPEGTPDLIAGDDEVHHFVYLSARSRSLDVSALTPDGQILDSFGLLMENAE